MVRLLLIHLPGGVGYTTNIGTFTVSSREGLGEAGSLGTSPGPGPLMPCPHAQVAAEVLEELCEKMGITEPEEVQEFALFLIKGEGEAWGEDARLHSGGLPCPVHFCAPG